MKVQFMLVDIFCPKLNLVIELQGPTHFIKNIENLKKTKLNNITKYKNRCIKNSGFNLISIPFNVPEKFNCSFERYFLKKLHIIEKESKLKNKPI